MKITPQANDDYQDETRSKSPNKSHHAICSLKVFLISTILLLIIVNSITIYVSVFSGLYSSVNSLTDISIDLVEDQVHLFVNQVLERLVLICDSGADNYNKGIITSSNTRDYLFAVYNNSKVSMGFFFGIPTERYTIVEILGSLTYTYQKPGSPALIRDLVLGDGSVLKYNFTVDMSGLQVMAQPFYNSSIKAAQKLGLKGAFGSIFLIVGGSTSLQYGSLIYNQQLFSQGVKSLVGITRCNIPLYAFSNVLNNIKVFERGYILLIERVTGLTIAGSINTTSADLKSQLNIFDISDRDAGLLMQKYYTLYSNTTMNRVKITSNGIGYIISRKNFIFYNIDWYLLTVIVENDVTLNTTICVSVSAVCFLVIVISTGIFGTVLSNIITRPILTLQRQLEFVKILDLDNVKLGNSIFTEVNFIYSSLLNTVEWLKQIKSFIPETVFRQLMDQYNTTRNSDSSNHNGDGNGDENHEQKSSKNLSFYSSKKLSSKQSMEGPRDLFHLGLQRKNCTVIFICFSNLLSEYSLEDVSAAFPNIIAVIKDVIKLYHCDFQVLSTSEFIIPIEHNKERGKSYYRIAQECALKIKKSFDISNSKLEQSGLPKLEYFIGISSGNSMIGNLGNQNFRFYSIISHTLQLSKQLALFAMYLKVPILIDETTKEKTKSEFIYRPVDRVYVDKTIQDCDPFITTVYQLVGENLVAADEWMYELENKNQNNTITQVEKAFELFQNSTSTNFNNLRGESCKIVAEYLNENPMDVASLRLLDAFKNIPSEEKAKVYHSTIRTEFIQQFSIPHHNSDNSINKQ